MNDYLLRHLRVVNRIYGISLLRKQNVVGVGVGYKRVGGEMTNELCIAACVAEKLPPLLLEPGDLVPPTLWGFQTDVVQTGAIRTLDQLPTDRWRPAFGGVSIGHPDVSAGTLGCLILVGGKLHILSNNHVLANSNLASIGDPIVQPGTYDGGVLPDDQIARLADFVPIQFALEQLPECPTARSAAYIANKIAKLLGSRVRMWPVAVRSKQEEFLNLVDAAIAEPLKPGMVVNKVWGIGVPTGSAEAELGEQVQNSGRTTGWPTPSTGEVLYLDSTIQVMYPGNKLGILTDQIGTTVMLEGGDSGSALFNMAEEFVGLGFAGSTGPDGVSYHNKASHVLDAFGATIPA